MMFSLLLSLLSFAIGMTVKNNKAMKEMISIRNSAYVMMTEDGKIGRRFIFRKGKYKSDKVLTDYDLAFIWKDASIAFKALAFGGATGLQDAQNNWDVTLMGDANLLNFFGVIMLVSLGKMKR